MKSEKSGIERITIERDEQINKHQYSVPHDVTSNKDQQLSQAINVLSIINLNEYMDHMITEPCPLLWDRDIWLKMCKKTYRERLIIVGALCAAEYDRLQELDHYYEYLESKDK